MSLSVVMALSAVALLGLGLISYLILHHRNRFQFFKLPHSQVLLLTAHPDDEVMFFAPTVLSLVEQGYNVVLLCLSSGDFDGLGSVRKKELESAAANLGIAASNIFVEDFKDDPGLTWDAEAIAQCLEKYHQSHGFCAVFTFDEHGISGHKNHISLFHGVSHFARSRQEPISVYFLKTVNAVRKYSSFLDSLFQTGPQKDLYFVSNIAHVFKSISSMLRHQSQMVWFRWLYIFFSRYMFFNTYHQGSGLAYHKTILLRENLDQTNNNNNNTNAIKDKLKSKEL